MLWINPSFWLLHSVNSICESTPSCRSADIEGISRPNFVSIGLLKKKLAKARAQELGIP